MSATSDPELYREMVIFVDSVKVNGRKLNKNLRGLKPSALKLYEIQGPSPWNLMEEGGRPRGV